MKALRHILPVTLVVVLLVASMAAAETQRKRGGFFNKTVRGSGELTTEDRSVKAFTEIESNIGADMVVTVGKPQSVKVTYDDNIIDMVTTEVKGGTLVIDADGSFSTRSNCLIEITVPMLEAVEFLGSGDIEVHGITGPEFTIDISGSGDVELDGEVDELFAEISGSGEIDARKLVAKDVDIEISGSGEAVVNALASLSGEVSGSGDIRYLGEPEVVRTNVSGSGSIRRAR